MNQQNQDIQFAIKEIRELEFLVNEQLELATSFDLNYNVDISTVVPAESVTFTVTINYFLHKTKEAFMKSKVATTFIIKDLKSRASIVADKERVDLPDALLVTMFSISFSHTRAIHAKSSAGSKYGHLLLPLINPEVEFRKIFGKELEKLNP